MEPSLFLSMLGFLWVAAITPGPNNLLLTTSGAHFGFMRSLWLMIGIMLGSVMSRAINGSAAPPGWQGPTRVDQFAPFGVG